MSISRADGTAARLGGDEFALLLPSTALPAAEATARRLRDAVRALSCHGATVSVGVAVTTEPGDASALLAAADAAVYRAKRSARDTVALAVTPGPDAGSVPGRRTLTVVP